MKKTIRKVLSLVLALAFVFSLAACGGAPSSAPAASGSAPASGSEPAAPADPTTLKVYTWWDVTKFEHLQKMQQDFEAANPDIKLEFVTIPSKYADTMVTKLAGGEIPDVMMLAMDQLTFFSLNLHGTRAEVIVREREEGPDLRPEGEPSDVVAAADGIITHIEPWAGDAQVHEGDAVCQGDVLISGVMDLDPIPPSTESLGTRIVHAEGKVLARTWRTLTAQIPLTATEKVYTGERTTRYTLSLMGKRVKIFGKSGIPYETYDTITEQAAWTPIPGKTLPLVWEKETYRAYTLESVAVDPDQAEALLRAQLLAALEEQMDQGKVLQTDWEVTEQDGMLEVKLLAQCSEQIGRQAALHLPAQRPEASPPEPEGDAAGTP